MKLIKSSKKKINGLENEYVKAMEKLDKYYGDTPKVVQACTMVIRSHPQVQLFDYKGMLSLKTCPENNYTRLRCKKLEHEMSNTHTKELILKKFPIQENVEWSKIHSKAEDTVKEKPFPEFIK